MKRICLDIKESDIRDPKKLVDIVKEAMQWHARYVVPFFDKDDAEYDGTETSEVMAKNNSSVIDLMTVKATDEIVAPKAKYIVDTATALFAGVPPEISTQKGNKGEKKKVENFNDMLRYRNFPRELFNGGKHCSKYGEGFILAYTVQDDDFPRYKALPPRWTNVIFDASIEPRPMIGFTFSKQRKADGSSFYRIYVYTKDLVYTMDTGNTTDMNIAFAVNEYNEPIVTEHAFGEMPITMFVNNEDMRGDARPAYQLIDAYNDLQTNRLQNVQDILDYVLMLKNVDLGNNEERLAFKELLKEKVLALKGDNTDAKFLANPLDQKQMQELLKSIEDDIYQVTGVPNFNSDTFSQNASGVALQMKLLNFIYLVNEKERNFTPAMVRIIELTKNFLVNTKGEDEYAFDIRKCTVEYTHNLPSNDQEMIAQITNLNNAGILDPNILRRLSFIGGNVDEYLANAKEYLEEKRELEAKYKVVDNGNGKENEGLNKNNLDKQNEKPVDKTLQDNKVNATVGDSKKLSEDK